MQRVLTGTTLALLVAAVLVGATIARSQEAEAATATLYDQGGTEVGTVVIAPSGPMTIVRVEARNLPPGFHGFHVHAVGDCVGDFTSAGGHHNPDGAVHGHHHGDMPPLLVNSDGTAQAIFVVDRFTFADLLDANGSAIIVHADPDNLGHIPTRYVAQPDEMTLNTGDAGGRIGCGVLEPAQLRAEEPFDIRALIRPRPVESPALTGPEPVDTPPLTGPRPVFTALISPRPSP